jgi:hypothetical protein
LSGQEQSQDKLLQERAKLFGLVVAGVREALQPLVDQVEERSPGHNFGQRVMNHMEGLQAEAESLGREEFLRPEEVQLLGLCLGIHDIGRVVCEAERPGDRAYQHAHGAVGAEFLRSQGLLRKLSPDDKQVILDAVEQHSVKDVTLPEGTLSHTVCYLLRDLDKAELLGRNEAFLSPEGALKQINMWMLSDGARESLGNADDAEVEALHELIRPILLGERVPESLDGLSELAREVVEHLVRDIPNDFSEKVRGGALLSKEEMISGYPAYMLAQVANANDIYTRGVRGRIQRQDLLGPRVRYLQLVTPEVAPAVDATLNRLSEDR